VIHDSRRPTIKQNTVGNTLYLSKHLRAKRKLPECVYELNKRVQDNLSTNEYESESFLKKSIRVSQ